MAAPDPYTLWTATPRINPTNATSGTSATGAFTQMDDGHSTLLLITGSTDICFWEKTVKPPGMDGGDPIDTTTMHNVTWRTQVPRSLVTMTPCNLTAAYDAEMWCTVPSVINVNTEMLVRFPNGDMVGFFGFLQSVEPQDHSEGAQPEVNIVIGITNMDTDLAEQAPVWSNSTGTACS